MARYLIGYLDQDYMLGKKIDRYNVVMKIKEEKAEFAKFEGNSNFAYDGQINMLEVKV